MAITRACFDRFRSNFAQSFTTWQPIHSFKVKGSKVKVTAYVRDNADWLQNLCKFLAYLLLTRGVAPRGPAMWLAFVVARRNFPKRIIFEQKTQKMLIICQIDWREFRVAFELQYLCNCMLSSWLCNICVKFHAEIFMYCWNINKSCRRSTFYVHPAYSMS